MTSEHSTTAEAIAMLGILTRIRGFNSMFKMVAKKTVAPIKMQFQNLKNPPN